METDELIQVANAATPAGRWGVAVSGGADSVALLLLLQGRPDLLLHVVHLDHETRDGQSTVDAQFVASLATTLGLPCAVKRRSVIEANIPSIKKNTSARFRQARFCFFQQMVQANHLDGIILAHHADDQAETILQRILRGANPAGLGGMRNRSTMRGLRILRPLLGVCASALRTFLHQRQQDWREDSSNQSDRYQRNRLRKWLVAHPGMTESLLRIGTASKTLDDWLEVSAPQLPSTFAVGSLNTISGPLATRAAARWLLKRGVPASQVSQLACERLLEMAADAASPGKQSFPGGLSVRRKQGTIFAEDR